MRIYTRTGDDGSTGLFYGGRVSKAAHAPEAYGSVDETVAALGLARAAATDGAWGALILRLQRELFVVGADLATNPERRGRLTAGESLVTAEMVAGLEELIDREVERRPLPEYFVVPGANPLSAGLDLARTAARRAERRTVAMRESGGFVSEEVGHYLNRLSDLLFVLARAAAGGDEAASREA